MKAHFIGSTINLNEQKDTYREITKLIRGQAVELTSDWLEEALGRPGGPDNSPISVPSWGEIYRDNIEAITRADIVVAEVSERSFLVGFQVANALQLKKPILMLSNNNESTSTMGVSMNEDIIKFCVYTTATLSDTLRHFIQSNQRGGKQVRFNFFVDNNIQNYLDWAALQTGKNKSEIVRTLIEEAMDDSAFTK